MLRILANKNSPGPVIAALRQRGHDVVAVKETMRGASDAQVLAAAQTQERTVVTFDKDFGELAFKAGLPAACGVVLFRLNGLSPESDNARALSALESRDDWAGHFATILDARISMRPIAGAARKP